MIPLHKVFMPENIDHELKEILYSGQLAYGKYAKKFECELREYIGNPYTIVITGNSVLFALQMLGVKEGDEIIASPMSCLMTTQPISVCGAKVIWSDIDPSTGTLCPSDLTKRITKNTKAIIHYHWAGYPGYIDEINEIGRKFGITVIEEANCAFGSEYKGKKIGNNKSDIVCFSFGPVRVPNAVDAGALSFSNKVLFDQSLLKRDFGIDRNRFRDEKGEINENCDVKITGVSSTLNDIFGFIGLTSLKNVDQILKRQRYLAKNWHSILQNHLQFLDDRSDINPNYWVFCINANDKELWRKTFFKNLFQTSSLHIRNDIYSVFGNKVSLKGVEFFSKHHLVIPSGWWIEDYDLYNFSI